MVEKNKKKKNIALPVKIIWNLNFSVRKYSFVGTQPMFTARLRLLAGREELAQSPCGPRSLK